MKNRIGFSLLTCLFSTTFFATTHTPPETESAVQKSGTGICACPESKPLKTEVAEKQLKYFQETKPYNSFDLEKELGAEQATKHFTELPSAKGRGVVSLNTPEELNACLGEGDVLVYFRTSNNVPSANNLQGHIQEGTSHAAIVMKDKDGKFFHIDSPQGYGGPYNFSGPFHILKLRGNKTYDGKKKEEVLKEVKALALKMKDKVSYDSTLTTDIEVQGKKRSKSGDSALEITKKGCELVCSQIEGGKCPPMYCSELVYTLYAIAGVHSLEAESLSAMVKRLEEDVLKGLPEGEKALMRERFVNTMFNDPALRAVMGEAQRNATRSLVETLLSPNTPEMVRRMAESTRSPIFFPHSFVREVRKENGAFCYAGSYLGNAFGTGGRDQAMAAAQRTEPSANLYLTLQGHTGKIVSARFSPDGKTILTASADSTAKLWDPNTGALKATLQGHSDSIQSAWFSSDGKMIATSSDDKTAKLWDAQTGALKHTLGGHTNAVRFVEFSPDGQSIVTSSAFQSGPAKLWDTQTGALKASFSHKDESTIFSAKFSPDGKWVATASTDNTVKLWNAKTGKLQATIHGSSGRWMMGYEDQFLSAGFSPDGKTLVTSSSDTTAKLWDVQSRTLKRTLGGHPSWVSKAKFSPDGKTVLTSSLSQNGQNENFRLWNAKTGALVASITEPRPLLSETFSQFSPDGKTLITPSKDRGVKFWNSQTGAPIAMVEGHTDGVNSLQFSKDGKSAVTGSHDQTAKVWDYATGTLKTNLHGHTSAVNFASFSPDGKTLVTGSDDNTAKIWINGSSVAERATEFMNRLYIQNPEDTEAALRILGQPDHQTEWKNILSALKSNAHFTREAVHTLINNQVSATSMQGALKRIADTFY